MPSTPAKSTRLPRRGLGAVARRWSQYGPGCCHVAAPYCTAHRINKAASVTGAAAKAIAKPHAMHRRRLLFMPPPECKDNQK